MRGVSVPLIESVPEYEIRDGLVHVIVDGERVLCMPIDAFRKGIARSSRAIAEWELTRGKVLAFTHAARS
jgi:hypothetical protein